MKAFNAKRISAALLSAAMCASFACTAIRQLNKPETVSAETISDLPSEYQYAADWIWQNRVVAENSTGRWNTIFDQIIAGKGTINYVVKWQSYREVTLEQREQFEVLLSDSINAWTDYLVGYENWPYDRIDVKVVGWAVLDANCILDPQPEEIIYTDTKYYDSQYDTSNGVEEIPNLEPYAPDMLSRMYHFEHRYDPTFDLYNYPGGLDKRFDMYMWATQGFPSVGGCGGDWGQRLSDTAYLNMLDGNYNHVLVHEIGHGFGMTDFYGGEGASDGYPPGGFPGNGSSIMMAGSSTVITDFDGWFIRYMWTQIKDEEGRFDLANALPETTEDTSEPEDTSETEATTETDSSAGENTEDYLTFEDGTMLAFQNVNSNLFLSVQDGAAGNMANVCQAGTELTEANIWTLKAAGDGGYYLYSKLAGGETYLLDVYYALPDDGTNIGLYEFTYSPAQVFRFLDNGDGTITIVTQASGNASCLQTAGASLEENANVEQSARNGSNTQKWTYRTVQFMGYRGDLNGDDALTAEDCRMMAAHLTNRTALDYRPTEFVDLTKDGVMNGFDLALLKRMAAGNAEWMALYYSED